MLTVPVVPSPGAPSNPMRSSVSTGTPGAPRAGRREPDGTVISGEPVTVTVRGFTSPGPDGGGGGGGGTSGAPASGARPPVPASAMRTSGADPSGEPGAPPVLPPEEPA